MIALRPSALARLLAVLFASIASITLLFELAPFPVFSVGWGRQHVDVVIVGHVEVGVACQVLGLHDGGHQIESCESSHLSLVSLEFLMIERLFTRG